MNNRKITRRRALQGLTALGVGAAAGGYGLSRRSRAAGEGDGPRFLIVLAASGGASIIDAMLAIRDTESANASTINTFPEAMVQDVAGSPFRAVDQSFTELGAIPAPFSTSQSTFVQSHHQDMMVATLTATSVNHAIAQRRSITGNEAWYGRTLQEAVALQHGEGFALPNVHLLAGTGHSVRGTDDSIPGYCFGEMVADPKLWPLALDGVMGTSHPVDRGLLGAARSLRNDRLDPKSRFSEAFGASSKLQEWKRLRGVPQQQVETAQLINQLMVLPDSAEYPLSANGLSPSPDGELVRSVFPGYETDPLDAQAALAFLLLKNRVSVSVTLGPDFNASLDAGIEQGQGIPEGGLNNPPIAFDFSHQSHRAAQAFMWERVMRVADGLITLLQGVEWEDGESMWDRTMIYLASDFGRTKTRPSGSETFGSGHDLNNAVLAISPLVNGNSVLGGVDPDTGLTYGFDPISGAPQPGRTMTEPEIYSGLLGAMGVESGSELPSVPAMRKA
jgi:hypothetical protein